MLKKTALSLFGLVVMLICINPPQAHAGVVIALGPTYPRPVYVRPYGYVAPAPYFAYGPTDRCMSARAGTIPATIGRTTTGQDTGVRVDSSIASTSSVIRGAGNKFQVN